MCWLLDFNVLSTAEGDPWFRAKDKCEYLVFLWYCVDAAAVNACEYCLWYCLDTVCGIVWIGYLKYAWILPFVVLCGCKCVWILFLVLCGRVNVCEYCSWYFVDTWYMCVNTVWYCMDIDVCPFLVVAYRVDIHVSMWLQFVVLCGYTCVWTLFVVLCGCTCVSIPFVVLCGCTSVSIPFVVLRGCEYCVDVNTYEYSLCGQCGYKCVWIL